MPHCLTEGGTPSILAHFLSERRSKRSIVNGRVYKENGTGREPQPKEESAACRTQGEQLSRQVAHVDELMKLTVLDTCYCSLVVQMECTRSSKAFYTLVCRGEHICLLPYGFLYALNSQPLACSHFSLLALCFI